MRLQGISVLAFPVTILLASCCVITSCQCQLGNANTDTGHALIDAILKSFTAVSYSECLSECVRSAGCKSFNFLITNGMCDLNSESKTTRPDLHVRRANSIYTTKKDYHLELMEPRLSATNLPTTQTTAQSPTTLSPIAQVSYPKSCLEILRSGKSVGDGVYSIDPSRTGIMIQAYCDMTTDGGGWTIIKRTVFQTATPPQDLRIRNFEVISEFNTNDKNIFPNSEAFLDIFEKMGFHQIHYYCHKKSVGRVVSIRTRNDTVGHQVVRYFTDDDFAMANSVAACDSFDRLPEDTSVLGQNCAKWNKDTGTWSKTYGTSRTLRRPFYIKDSNTYGCTVNPPKAEYCTCDDDYLAPLPYNPQDRWQISVR